MQFKKSNCDETKKHKRGRNSKTQIGTKLKNSNCDKTQKLIVTKLKNSTYEKT